MRIGKCIVLARESRGVLQSELAKLCGIRPSEVCQIENGRVTPRFDRVERFAAALGMSVVEMLSFDDEVADVANHRKPSADYVATSVADRSISGALDLVSADAIELKAMNPRRQTATQLRFPTSRKVLNGAAVSLAEKMRSVVGLGKISNADLESLLLMKGVKIYRTKMSNKVQSIAFWSAKSRILSIVLNEANTPERDRFRLSFELAVAHIFFATKSVVDVNHVTNHRFIKEFSSSFLMPSDSVSDLVASRGITPSTWTFAQLLALKSSFAVSAESFALRLDELGLITNALRLNFREKLQEYYRKNPKAMEPIC